MRLIQRGTTYYIRKRVPQRFARVESRHTVWISLHTVSERLATTKASAAWAEMIEAWEARLAGHSSDAERRFEAARQLAQTRGFRYLPAERVATLSTDALLDRVEAIRTVAGKPDRLEAVAILGGAQEPALSVQRALDLYWTLAKDKTFGKSEDQLRRWKSPRLKAVRNFISIVGDKAVKDITGDDMLDFRQWWLDRVETEGLTPNSANKDLVHLSDVLRTVNKMKRLGLVLPLSDLALQEGEKRQRPPFSNGWITGQLLKPRALDGLNKEARCILLGMVNTGYRPSEGAGLGPSQIRLDATVPHIYIEPNGRQLKSEYSRRIIPLAGVSLEALRECPEGFIRVDHPVNFAQGFEVVVEDGLVGEIRVIAEELQLPCIVQPDQPFQNEPPVQTG